LAFFYAWLVGRARPPSGVDFLGDLKRIVDLNAEVAYGAEFVSIEAARDSQLIARPLAQHPEGVS
jgi:hypothetical protein